jgi:hypothetical protein
VILKDPKPSGQVAQVLSQMLTPVWTGLPQLVSLKVSMTKADPVAVRPAIIATVEVMEKRILKRGDIVEVEMIEFKAKYEARFAGVS